MTKLIIFLCIICFFLYLFKGKPKKRKEEQKKANKENKEFENKKSRSSSSEFSHDTNELSFFLNDIELNNLVLKAFFRELLIKDEKLNEDQEKFFISLKEEIVPKLKDDIKYKIVKDQDELNKHLDVLITDSLEKQAKTENRIINNLESRKDRPFIFTDYEGKKYDIEKPREVSTPDNLDFKEPKKFIFLEEPVISDENPLNNFHKNEDSNSFTSIDVRTVEQKEVNISPSKNEPMPQILREEPVLESNKHLEESVLNTSKEDNVNKEDIADKHKDITPFVRPLNMVDVNILEEDIADLLNNEEFEDKEYDAINESIDNLIVSLLEEEQKEPEKIEVVKRKQEKLQEIKKDINEKMAQDLDHEEEILKEYIHEEALLSLDNELEKLHVENQMDINNELLNELEDLNHLGLYDAKFKEKNLIKNKLKKAANMSFLASLISLPFIKNKYFLYFSSSLFVSTHLGFWDNILNRQSSIYTKNDFKNVRKGKAALEEALINTRYNIDYLDKLEMETLERYPELQFDEEFNTYLNTLKTNLLEQEERMLKKAKLINKYSLKSKSFARTRKRKKKQYRY